MSDFKITTRDIARFFYVRDISNSRRYKIILDLWQNKNNLLEYDLYDRLEIFSNEVNNLLVDLSLNNIINEETEEIIRIHKDLDLNYNNYGLYSLNLNKIESFLKKCKLRLMYESKDEYIYMKMRTLVKSCGYKKRSNKFVDDLLEIALELGLCLTYGLEELSRFNRYGYMKVMDITMDKYIRIYNYGPNGR